MALNKRFLNASLDLSNPAIIYSAVWIGGVLLTYVRTPFWIFPAPRVMIGIFLSCLSFLFWDFLLGALARRSGNTFEARRTLEDGHQVRLENFVRVLGIVWIVGFAINVIACRGLPLIWRLIHDPRSYVDFGVPSFSGTLMAIKLFLLSSLILLAPRWGWRKAALAIGVLFGTTVLELNRGGLTLMMLVAVGTLITSLGPLPVRRLKWAPVFGLLFIIAFGLLAQMRGVPDRVFYALAGRDSFFTKIPSGFFWIFSYWTSPIQNLYFAYETLSPSFLPINTSQLVFPSVLRSMTGIVDYPIPLLTPALNATTFLGPMMADFGFGLSIVLFIFAQFFFVYVYRKTREIQLPQFYLLNAINLATLALSVFYLYFLSLVILFYIFLVGVFALYCVPLASSSERRGYEQV